MRFANLFLAGGLLTGVLASLALAQPSLDPARFSPPLNPGNFVALGVSGSTAWYLDLSSQKVVACTRGNAAPSCESTSMPR